MNNAANLSLGEIKHLMNGSRAFLSLLKYSFIFGWKCHNVRLTRHHDNDGDEYCQSWSAPPSMHLECFSSLMKIHCKSVSRLSEPFFSHIYLPSDNRIVCRFSSPVCYVFTFISISILCTFGCWITDRKPQ